MRTAQHNKQVEDIWVCLLKGYSLYLDGSPYTLCKLVESLSVTALQEALIKHANGDVTSVIRLLKKQITTPLSPYPRSTPWYPRFTKVN